MMHAPQSALQFEQLSSVALQIPSPQNGAQTPQSPGQLEQLSVPSHIRFPQVHGRSAPEQSSSIPFPQVSLAEGYIMSFASLQSAIPELHSALKFQPSPSESMHDLMMFIEVIFSIRYPESEELSIA
jgi:hypothetical protein